MDKIQVSENYIQLVTDARAPSHEFLQLIENYKDVYRMSRMPGTYRCSIRMLPEVLSVMRNITSVEQITNQTIRDFYIAEMTRRSMTAELLQNGSTDTSIDTRLWGHQRLGVELARYNKRFNFFYDTRTGKTPMALAIMRSAIADGSIKRALVVTPSSIIPDWLGDAKKFYPELKVVAYHGTAQDKYRALHAPCHIFIISTNMLADNLWMLKQLNFGMCFFDESSKLKNKSSKTSEAAFDLSQHIEQWYNLSATPAPNGQYEYFTQMRTVDPYAFHPVWTHFVNKYFDDLSKSRKYQKLVIKPYMLEEFMSKVKEYSLYVDQKVMPIAPKEWIPVYYDLQTSERALYTTMAEDMFVEIGDKVLTASMSAIMRAKLNQLTKGFVLDTEAIKENKYAKMLGDDPQGVEVLRLFPRGRATAIQKLDEVLQCQELRDERCIIWANYAQEFADIQDLLGDHCRIIRGGTPGKVRDAFITDFRAGRFQYLVAHPLSIGMGLNLTCSHIAIYYSLNDSWEALKQSSERICGHITIQPKTCKYYIIMAKDTVNEIIYDNLKNKRDMSTGFLEHLKAVSLYGRTEGKQGT